MNHKKFIKRENRTTCDNNVEPSCKGGRKHNIIPHSVNFHEITRASRGHREKNLNNLINGLSHIKSRNNIKGQSGKVYRKTRDYDSTTAGVSQGSYSSNSDYSGSPDSFDCADLGGKGLGIFFA